MWVLVTLVVKLKISNLERQVEFAFPITGLQKKEMSVNGLEDITSKTVKTTVVVRPPCQETFSIHPNCHNSKPTVILASVDSKGTGCNINEISLLPTRRLESPNISSLSFVKAAEATHA